jgi:hypothetical protein
LFEAQLTIAKGSVFVYRIVRHRVKGEPTRIEHVLLTDPQEISDAFDTIVNLDPNGDESDNGNDFVYVVTKAPDNRAIDSLIDRVFGKATQKHAGDPDAQ